MYDYKLTTIMHCCGYDDDSHIIISRYHKNIINSAINLVGLQKLLVVFKCLYFAAC